MTFRSQGGSPRKNAVRQVSKSEHEKKAKERKQRAAEKYLPEQTETTPKDAVEKTLASLSRLGNQVFALSPFSQYFDDWLINLRRVISEFESNPDITVDEQFVKERTQIFLDVEAEFAQKRIDENSLTGEAKELVDNNHLLVETDKDYAEKTRQLSNKRNADVQRLSSEIRGLEDDVASQEQIKFSFYKFNAKKKASENLAKTRLQLKAKKAELEVTLSTFSVDQDKLHDAYQKKKQEITEKIESLHKTLERLETDTSTEPRQTACNALANTVNQLIQRKPPTTQEQ